MAEDSQAPDTSYAIRVIGAESHHFRDVYHSFLKLTWPRAFALIVASYLALNLMFAVVFLASGGIANLPEHDFFHAFSFSIQTMGTIGYGAMYPISSLAHVLVAAESVVGLLTTALATGLVFAKFSQPSGRVAFAKNAVVCVWDGVPTLMFRVGNERGNLIVEANVRVTMVKTSVTLEGVTFYKMIDLGLLRDHSSAMTRSWTVMHPLDATSPLKGMTPEEFARDEVELIVSISGVDDTSYQPVHARATYEHTAIVWGARHADLLRELPDGSLEMDVRRFHALVPAEGGAGFPYRWQDTPTSRR